MSSLNLPRKLLAFSPYAYVKRPVFGFADLTVGLGVLTLIYVVARVGAESLVKFNPPDKCSVP
jgi:hypothetical protein